MYFSHFLMQTSMKGRCPYFLPNGRGVGLARWADPWRDFTHTMVNKSVVLVVPKQLPGLNSNLSTLKVASLAQFQGDHHTRSRRIF
jgi:hypothetical protein